MATVPVRRARAPPHSPLSPPAAAGAAAGASAAKAVSPPPPGDGGHHPLSTLDRAGSRVSSDGGGSSGRGRPRSPSAVAAAAAADAAAPPTHAAARRLLPGTGTGGGATVPPTTSTVSMPSVPSVPSTARVGGLRSGITTGADDESDGVYTDDEEGNVGRSRGPTGQVIRRTVTRMEELPPGEQAVGTVLVEETVKPVALMIEFLGGGGAERARNGYVQELYDAAMEVSIECQYLPKADTFSNSDPYAVVSTRPAGGGAWREVVRTEVLVDTHNPRWVTKAVLDVTPERGMDDELLVQVWAARPRGRRADMLICQGVATVWDVCVAVGRCKVVSLDSVNKTKESWLILTGDLQRNRTPAEVAPVTVHVAYAAPGGEAPAPLSRRARVAGRLALAAADREKTFFVLNRGLPKARWTPVYRSEALRGGRGTYAPAVTTAGELWKGEAAAPARIEWWVERRGIDPKLLGFVHLTAGRVAAVAAATAAAAEAAAEGEGEGRESPPPTVPSPALQWFSGNDGRAPGVVRLAKAEVTDAGTTLWLLVSSE